MSAAPTAALPASPHRRRRRWRTAAILVLIIVLLHAPLLRAIGRFPIVADVVTGRADALLLAGDAEAARTVAELNRQGHLERVWIFSAPPRLTDELGLTESRFAETQLELKARGVPEAIVAEMRAGFNMHERAAACADYLRQHPDRRIVVATARLQGRYVRGEFAAVLSPDELGRTQFASLPPQSFDERTWWRHRAAIQMVFQAYLQLLLTTVTDLPRVIDGPIDWRAFEAAVARGEKP